MPLTSSYQRQTICALLLLTVLCGLYIYGSRRAGKLQLEGAIKIETEKTLLLSNLIVESHAVDESAKFLSKLIAESHRPNSSRNPVTQKCQMYQEFRQLDFLHPALRHKLCRSAEAYKRYPDGYPMCQLQNPFNEDMLNVVRQGSDIVRLDCMNKASVQLFAYKGSEHISDVLRRHHSWEPAMVDRTLRFALKVPNATFLDMGSNIGVYSIQAAKLGLPVVSLDANIRNLLRLRLTLNASSLDAALVWNFIAPDQSLKYLSFYADCNVGAAGRDKADLPDTVPVMPLSSARISSLIKTTNVVMKMDIQGGEATFLEMSGRLFTDFTVAAVQMEWYPPMIRPRESIVLTTFFTSRGYKAWMTPGMNPLDPKDCKSWPMTDIMWIHKDFVNLV